MSPLSNFRPNREEIEAEETRLLREMSVEESLRQYVALQREFEPWLQENDKPPSPLLG